MPAHGDWRYEIDLHPAQWRFPAGRSWIAGWLYAGPERAAADIRAWVDDRPFLGLCGLPRPEIERRLLGRDGPPHAGFSFLLEPHRGARWLRLDACDQEGRWEEIHRQEIAAAPDAVPAPAAPPLGSAISDLLIVLLRARRTDPSTPWSQLAGEVLAAHRAAPLNALPNPPFYGALEEPTQTGRTRYGRLPVTGWLAHRERTIVRLTAFADPLQPVPLLYGLPRHDVSGRFGGLRNAGLAQFTGQVDLPAALPQPIGLKIFAELDDGRRELVFHQRFRPQAVAGAEPALPARSLATFLRAAGALHAAARRQHLPGGGWSARITALRNAWHTYRMNAPMRRPATVPRVESRFPAQARHPLEVILVSHNLNLEGAPLFGCEYALHLAALPGWRVRAAAAQDGPVRRRFEAAGIPVEILPVAPLVTARTPLEFDRALAVLARSLDWTRADLIVANTMVAFWAVHLARHLRKPALLYVHETAPVSRFFGPQLAPALIGRVEEAFGLASRVGFIAAATLAVHARLERRGNFRLLPSWIDTTGIDRFAATHDRLALRRQHGLSADATIFANVGSVCERKGQHVFVRAIERFERDLAGAGQALPPRQYLMVGARVGDYLDSLCQEITLRRLTNIILIEETPEPNDFYAASDIFVCSSFEESFPRVLMEAAAFRLPIVSTNVDGVAEMLSADDAWLVPPGDAALLAAAMRAAWDAHLAGDRSRAECAARVVTGKFRAERNLPLHAALAADAADHGRR